MATKKLQMINYKIVPPEHVGKSAYEIAVDKGFEGTEEEWLEYLATLKIHTTLDLNEATAPGLYQVTVSDTENLPFPPYVPDNQLIPNDFGYGTVIVENNGERVYQTICNNNISAKRFYKPFTQTWSEWEYVNPPYYPDIHYRTTDRINGKAVYKRITSDGILQYCLDGEDTWYTYQDSLGITKESLGAAPAGYGIGILETHFCANDDDVDVVLGEQIDGMENQSFKRFVLAITAFVGGGGYFYVDIYKMNSDFAIITIKSYGKGGRTLQRVWTKESEETYVTLKPWEWENPPLEAGVEYRTTDRINNKAVIKKITSDGILRYRLDGETGDAWRTYQESLGAAPAGYGYGGTAILINAELLEKDGDLNTALDTIYDGMQNGETKLIRFTGFPSLNHDDALGDYAFFGFLFRGSASYGSLMAHSAYSKGCLITKTKYNDGWQPLEYVNPPLKVGVEYRTTERWNGEVVYRKLVSYTISSINQSGSYSDINIPHSISNFKSAISCVGKKDDGLLLPFLASTSGGASVNLVDGPNIFLRIVNDTYYRGKWWFDLKYTKSM